MIARAREVLSALEAGARESGTARAAMDDLPLFASRPQPEAPPATVAPSQVERRLQDIEPDRLSPIEALNLLYELRGLLPDRA